jgi:isoleucyl-tRNA synthetase
VRFPLTTCSRPALAGASAVIWTTTPWTLPGNRAIAYGDALDYAVYEVLSVEDGSRAKPGEKLLLAKPLADSVKTAAKITEWSEGDTIAGPELAGSVAKHPLAGQGYDFPVPLLAGDFVDAETGTGLVHIAPGHGADDFALGRASGIEIPETVAEDGRYYPHVPIFAGQSVYTAEGKEGTANVAVLKAIDAAGGMLAKGSLRHSYPHSWRSKAPLIFRTTPQWFISMDHDDLRMRALAAIDQTVWYPPESRNRIRAMIENRPDWCISRQRVWGVPIALFVEKSTGKVLIDDSVLSRIVSIFKEEGSDAWFTRPAQDFLGNAYKAEDFEQVRDIVDVWFESGSTHAFVLEDRPELRSPADLYLEGSDQHRGWFHSTLLQAMATGREAPYKGVFTHGFVLDEKGYKLSKSAGNYILPSEIMEEYGADILRLWVVGSAYHEDVRIGDEILKHTADLYRRLRNTLRYLLGALSGWREEERLSYDDMPELERYVLHLLWAEDEKLRARLVNYDLHRCWQDIHNFCAVDLSAFYFDIRKDALYCDAPDSTRRRATRTVMMELFSCLTAWLAPVIPYTAEEAWQWRIKDSAETGTPVEAEASVHLRDFPEIPKAWQSEELAEKWDSLRDLRRVVLGALEIARAEKKIGSALEAAPELHADAERMAQLKSADFAELTITSSVNLAAGDGPADAFRLADVPGLSVVVKPAPGAKCARCWQVLEEVGTDGDHPELCRRCAGAAGGLVAAAE